MRLLAEQGYFLLSRPRISMLTGMQDLLVDYDYPNASHLTTILRLTNKTLDSFFYNFKSIRFFIARSIFG